MGDAEGEDEGHLVELDPAPLQIATVELVESVLHVLLQRRGQHEVRNESARRWVRDERSRVCVWRLGAHPGRKLDHADPSVALVAHIGVEHLAALCKTPEGHQNLRQAHHTRRGAEVRK